MAWRLLISVWLILFLSLSGLCQTAPNESSGEPYDTILVVAPALRAAAKPWIDFRSQQGHVIAEISAKLSNDQIARRIAQLAKNSPSIKHVVLMGDGQTATGPRLDSLVPTFHVPAEVIAKWQAEPLVATDHFYGDVDKDGLPDLAVGRICADTPQQLSDVIRKIISYEVDPNCDTWRRRVNFVAGVGGFGVLADKIIETSAKKFITSGIPSQYKTSMTQASWRSPYSPDPRLFRAQTIETMNQGCFAWVYMGHGQKRALDYYLVPDGGLPIFEQKDLARVDVRVGSPIAVFLACHTGAFAADEDCLAEEFLKKANGPVAVLAASNVTMPYAMTVMGNAMLEELFEKKRETIGDVLLHAKRTLATPTEGKSAGLVDQLAKVISPDPDLLDEERAEHARLFHLFGDPLMRLRYPKEIAVELQEDAVAGETISIQGESPLAGNGIIELVCRRDRTTFRPPARRKFEFNDDWLRSLQETYVKANNTTWTSTRIVMPSGNFEAKLTVPNKASGLAHVRVYVRGAKDFAMGAANIYLRAAQQQPVASLPNSKRSPAVVGPTE